MRAICLGSVVLAVLMLPVPALATTVEGRARVVDGAQGQCKGAMVCPFHGWVYNTDGTLRGAAAPTSFGTMDRSAFGLKPIELEIFHGFLFLRFHPGPQPPVADLLAQPLACAV